MSRRPTNPLTILRKKKPWDIAANVTLREAAEITTGRPQYLTERMAAAFHEAAHIVVAAHLGIRTITVQLPQNLYRASACMNVDGLSPHNPMDITTELEQATIDFAGEVAEGINGTITGCPLPVFRDGINDTRNGLARIAKFLSEKRRLTLDPAAWPYIEQWAEAHPANGYENQSPDEHKKSCVQAMQNDALAIVARNFELIDAVAAVILAISENRSHQIWPDDIAEWLQVQVRMPSYFQHSAGRDCAYQFPDWLKPYLTKNLYPYHFTRNELRRLQMATPRSSIEDLMATMDFGIDERDDRT
ncbi:MAG: hypothetical protein Q7U05_07045 [Polaromonas sp.]|nr:hypothetical protein [Polaromonas sp.]